MLANDLHHKIEACQQQMETLMAAAVSPAPSQAALLEARKAFQALLEALHVAEAARRQQHDDLIVAH